MDLLNKKLFIPFLFLLCILCSCDAGQEKYSLLFTSDITYGKDKSYYVTYTEEGKVKNKTEIEGALHYNIIRDEENKIIFNNGKTLITIDNSDITSKNLGDKPLGYLEQNSYFFYKNRPIFVYNVGFTEENKYESMIQLEENNNIYFKGFVESFWTESKYFYALVSSYDDNIENMYIVKIDLDSGKIENEEKINLKKESNIVISKLRIGIINNNAFVLKEVLNSKASEITDRKIITISLNDFNVKEHDIKGISTKEKIYYDSFFKFQDSIYFIADNKIYYFLNENMCSVKQTSIELPEEFGEASIVKENNNKIYLLEPGDELYITEIDLNKEKFSKPVKLERPNYLKNMSVYSYIVE